MPRNYKSTSKFQKPDPRYGSMIATKFINQIMSSGKKTVAMAIFYEACEAASKKLKEVAPEDVFMTALENVRPSVEVRSKRVGGSNYQVPREVSPKRAQALAIRWLITNARKKKGMPMARRLATEFTDACNNTGTSVQWKENVHKMADANKAYSHFAF
jgi:small subunit ribosomal protein S7